MTGLQIALLVGVFLVMDLMVVGALFHVLSQTMRDFSAKFPAVEPLPNAERRRFQSFKFGMISLGGSVHVGVDERYLHLMPTRAARWLGMKPLSVPWEAIEIVGNTWIGRSTRVRIAQEEVVGPRWCLQLAESELADQPPPIDRGVE